MESINLVIEYFQQGGMVSVPLLMVFLLITYTVGYRMSILLKGRNLHVREAFKNPQSYPETVQSYFLNTLNKIEESDRTKLEEEVEWHLLDSFQHIHRYSGILNTAVMLAPLLGLLGTVIGMIETFASLSDADLFSSSGGIAGGISQALITTQFGLIVAIPGVFLSRFLKKVENKTYMDLIQMKELFYSSKAEV